MTEGKKHVFVILLALSMLVFGLLLPTLLEWIAGRSDGAFQTVQTEVIRVEGTGGSVMELLKRINSAGADITEQHLEEGYNYTQVTAQRHAVSLVTDYLTDCGFKGAAKILQDNLLGLTWTCDATLLVAADYPTPWSAIVWDVFVEETDLVLMFDDASGAMLGCNLPLVTEEDLRTTLAKQPENMLELTAKCSEVFAEQLGASVSAGYDQIELDDSGSQSWLFTIKDEEAQEVIVTVTWYNFHDDYPRVVIQPVNYDGVEASEYSGLGW